LSNATQQQQASAAAKQQTADFWGLLINYMQTLFFGSPHARSLSSPPRQPPAHSSACSPAENSNKLFGVAVVVSVSVIALFTFSLSLTAAEQLALIS